MTVELGLVARRVAAGDAAAFRAIVEHTEVRLYRVAARVLGDLAEAEDAVQEAYVKAYQALSAGRYDGRAEVGTWLYRIVTNCCLDALRRRAAGARAAERAPRFAEQASAEVRVALRELDARLATLPPAQRVAVVLTAVEGLSTREAAEVLECTEGAVEQRLQRARGALRAEGRDEGSDEGSGDG